MNKRFLLISLGVLSIATAMQARSRSAEEAKQVAAEFYQSQNGLRSASDVEFTLVYSGSENGLRASTGEAPFYVFNIGSADGFVMVSGDDRVAPVIGYSLTSAFNPDNMPSNLRGWLEGYEKQIEYARTLPDKPYVKPETRAGEFPESVEPLITTQWDQGAPYNNACPEIGNERALTGCVATAMAQIMNYHEWPASAEGTGSYTIGANGTPQSIDMSQFTFDWANMADKYDGNESADEQKAVAQLMAACGAGVQMQYGTDVSGAYDANAAAALIQNMGYDENVSFVIREAYSNEEWTDMMKAELDAERPILYGGYSGFMRGHAFVCDGYADDYFHINWGWSGQSDGFYNLDLLWPYEDIFPNYMGFTESQDAVIGIQKSNPESVSHEEIVVTAFYLPEEMYELKQHGTIQVSMLYRPGFATPKKAKLAIDFKNTETGSGSLYPLRDEELDGYHYYSVPFTMEDFSLDPGMYDINLLYSFDNGETWKQAKWSYSALNSGMMLKATDTDLIWYSTRRNISGTPIKLSLYGSTQYHASTTITNTDESVEFHARLGFHLTSQEPGVVDTTIRAQGILYLEPGEQQEANVIIDMDLKPGVYTIEARYEDDIYYNTIEGTAFTFRINESTANETISANDFSIRVYTDRIAVQSASTVRQIELYDISGRLAGSIRGANELPVDGLADGVYIVRVTTDEGVQTEKVILHR